VELGIVVHLQDTNSSRIFIAVKIEIIIFVLNLLGVLTLCLNLILVCFSVVRYVHQVPSTVITIMRLVKFLFH